MPYDKRLYPDSYDGYPATSYDVVLNNFRVKAENGRRFSVQRGFWNGENFVERSAEKRFDEIPAAGTWYIWLSDNDEVTINKTTTVPVATGYFCAKVIATAQKITSVEDRRPSFFEKPPTVIPSATESRTGTTSYATQSEANALVVLDKALTPGKLPRSTETQVGATAFASQAEANALVSTSKALTPGKVPVGTITQKGIVQVAALTEKDSTEKVATPDFVRRSTHYMGELLFAMRNSPPSGFLRFIPGWEGSRTTYADFYAECSDFLEAGSSDATFKLPASWGGRAIAISPNTTANTKGNATVTTETGDGGAHTPIIQERTAGTPSVQDASAGTPVIKPGGRHKHASLLSGGLNYQNGTPTLTGAGQTITGAVGSLDTDYAENHPHDSEALPNHGHPGNQLPPHGHTANDVPHHKHPFTVSVTQPTIEMPTFIYVGVFT